MQTPTKDSLQAKSDKIRAVRQNQKTPISLGYDLFILAVSVLSIANIFILWLPIYAQSKEVIQIINLLLSIIFFADFLFRLHNAKSKQRYFFADAGWLDLLSSIPVPVARILRMLRIIKVVRTVKLFGLENMVNEFTNDRAKNTLLMVVFLLLLVFEFGGAMIVAAEKANPNANIKTGGDALWWTYVTVTTVGYGDRFPVTPTGRLVGVLVMAAGVGLFGVLTGFLANSFLAPKKKVANAVKQADEDPKYSVKQEIAKIRASLDELESKL